MAKDVIAYYGRVARDEQIVPRTVAYLRVSTDNQAEKGFGLDVQRDRIEAYAKAMGWTSFDHDDLYVDDGFTGTTTDRPALQRLIADCAAGEIERVIVYKLDRLSRKQRGILEIIEDHFEKNGVAFVSVSEQFDTSSAFGKAMIGILGVFAQLDRDQIVERLRNGKKAKASTGERVVGDVPYGYRVVDGKTVVDDLTASVVKRIFTLAGRPREENGRKRWEMSLDRIADVLNREYVRTPKGGKRWYGSTIRTILENPIYIGRIDQTVGGTLSSVINPMLALI